MLENIPLLLDKPLNSVEADQFGHEHYAEVLFDLIANKELNTPYNIGLLGQWGVGKSSIKELCRNKLNSMKNIYCIDFNAWKYGGDCIKRALLKTIYTNIGGKDEEIKDTFSRQISRQILALNDMKEISKNWINVLLNYFQIIASVYVLFFIYSKCLPYLEDFGQACASISFAILAGVLIKELLNKNNLLTPIFQNITKIDLPETTAEVYEEFLIKKLKKYKKRNKEIDKIVVFVDDIDRLPTAKEMVDGINAIRSFMDIKLKSEIGFIFVVSCCEYKISDALITVNSVIDKNYNDNCSKQTESKRFLDKIFHFRIDIPPFPYRDMIDYSEQLLKTQIPNFKDFEIQLKQTGTDLENLLCRLIYPNVQNPRQAIQILNTFFQNWNIATRRESDEMNDKAGGLAKGIVTKHPLTLAILAVLKVDFPYFYKELLIEPKLLSYILEVLRTGKTPRFYIDSKIRDKFLEISNKETKTWKLKSCFYDLNQYLNLINNKFELPLSLKPFLLLNQNSLSREYGEQAYEIEEALIHNSPEKLFRILNLDNNKLSIENAQLIKSVYESLSYNLHKENAFSVIIKLISFISDETKFLIDSFADTLFKNSRYREILSVDDYKKLLYSVSESKVEKIIASLNKTYRTKYSYDTSSNEDKVRMNLFKDASNVLLDFYNANQDYIDDDFCKWIISPIFASENTTEGEDFDFGFEYSYYAFQNYEFLYQYKSKEYINLVVKEFQSRNSYINKENEAQVLQTFEKALDYVLINDNEEFNSIFDNIVEVENTRLYSYITDYTKKSLSNYTDTNLNNYLIQLDVVIENKLNNDIKTEFDVKEQLRNFRDLLNTYFQNIKSDNYEYIDDLCKVIILNEDFTNEILEIIVMLKNNKYDNISKIDKLIIDQLFQFEFEYKNLKMYLNYLFENYKNLSNENKIIFAQNYANFIMDTNVNSLEDSILNDFKQYIDIILLEKNQQVASILLDKFFDFTNDYLIPSEEKEYFEQLLCLLQIFPISNSDKIKDFIILVLEDADFAFDYSDKIGSLILSCEESIWSDDNRIDESFNQITTVDVNDKKIDCAISLYNAIARLQTNENLNTLYQLILELTNIELKEKKEWLSMLPKEKIYTIDKFIRIITEKTNENIDRESVKALCEMLIGLYSTEEREYILLKLLLNDNYRECFKIVMNALYDKTGKFTELNNIIDKNSRNSNIKILLSKRTLITDMLLGENRKEPSKILLLNTKIIEESEIEDKEEVLIKMLQWSYDLYNDIIRDLEIRGFSDNLKEIINKIFVGKTFGKIRFRNKEKLS